MSKKSQPKFELDEPIMSHAADAGSIEVRGDKLSEIWWRGSQWAVTRYGLERLDGGYFIEAERLAEGGATAHGWISHMAGKSTTDLDDFMTAYSVALVMHGYCPKVRPASVADQLRNGRSSQRRGAWTDDYLQKRDGDDDLPAGVEDTPETRKLRRKFRGHWYSELVEADDAFSQAMEADPVATKKEATRLQEEELAGWYADARRAVAEKEAAA